MIEHKPSPRSVRVCYFGTYRAEYTRNKVAIKCLQLAGFDVVICNQPLWLDFDDRVRAASGGWIKPAFWIRVMRAYVNLLKNYSSIGEYDILMIGYPGHFDVFLGRILSRLRKKPLVWEVIISLYLILLERGIANRHKFTANLIQAVERGAVKLPDLLFLDSTEFINWFKRIHNAPVDRFRVFPIGADADELPGLIHNDLPNKQTDVNFHIIYYGSYIPNHGVTIILEAARLLKDDPFIHFELIGDGPERKQAELLASNNQLENVTFVDWLDKSELATRLARANVCLGSLGDTLQATLTNNNKIFEAFSLKIPVITGKSPALPSDLIHGTHLYICERGNSIALAEAIRTLKSNPALCKTLGENGNEVLKKKYDLVPLSKLLNTYLRELPGISHD